VNIWSDYVISDMNLVEVAQLATKMKNANLVVDVLPGDFHVRHVFDLSVPVDVYEWNADWLRNWYIKALGNVGQAFAAGVNTPDFGTSR